MTIHLLNDCAKKARIKLHILFIDFEKAYDKVSRIKLTEELKVLGSDRVVLQIIINIYTREQNKDQRRVPLYLCYILNAW